MSPAWFWNGDGFEWLSNLVGPNLAAIIVILVAALYTYDYLFWRRNRLSKGVLDQDVAAQKPIEHLQTTDIRHLRNPTK